MADDTQQNSEGVEEFFKILMRRSEQLALCFGRAAKQIADAAPPSKEEKDLGVHTDLPAFFCIRQSVELALKDLLWAHHNNEADLEWMQAAKREPQTAKPLDNDTQKELRKTHDLKWLLEKMELHLPSYVKPNWKQLVEKLIAIETNRPDWSRFDQPLMKVPKFRNKNRKENLYERPDEIPIKDLVAELEVFLQESVYVNWQGDYWERSDSWSALQWIITEGNHQDQELTMMDMNGQLEATVVKDDA